MERSTAGLNKDKKKLEAYIIRIVELDKIIQRLYEDRVLERITEQRFDSMITVYENEQQDLRTKSSTLEDA